jgi:hypothetical protein
MKISFVRIAGEVGTMSIPEAGQNGNLTAGPYQFDNGRQWVDADGDFGKQRVHITVAKPDFYIVRTEHGLYRITRESVRLFQPVKG